MAATTQAAPSTAPDANGIRIKGFLGTANEMTKVAEVMAPKTVEWVRSLTDAEIIPMGVKALGDIADDILVLDEIRQRFRRGHAIEGYANWTEFVEKNSKYGIRTIQKRLATVNGKDESKINKPETLEARRKPTELLPLPQNGFGPVLNGGRVCGMGLTRLRAGLPAGWKVSHDAAISGGHGYIVRIGDETHGPFRESEAHAFIKASRTDLPTAAPAVESVEALDAAPTAEPSETISEASPWVTRHGHDFFEVSSALQKAVRRSDMESALYWAWELGSSSPNHAARLWSRLHVMASEDIGIADSAACILVRNLHERWREKCKDSHGDDHQLYYLHATAYLAQATKSRLINNAICAFEGELKLGMPGMDLPIPDIDDIEKLKLEIPDCALGKHTKRGKNMGRGVQFFLDEEAKLVSNNPIPVDPFEARAQSAMLATEADDEPVAASKRKSRKAGA